MKFSQIGSSGNFEGPNFRFCAIKMAKATGGVDFKCIVSIICVLTFELDFLGIEPMRILFTISNLGYLF